MRITKLDHMIDVAKSRPKKRLVVAFGQDPNTIGAIDEAVRIGIVNVTLVGDREKIKEVCAEKGIDVNQFELVDEPNEAKSGIVAVKMIRDGEADIIMKGLIATDKYMRAILNKQDGLLPPGGILSHVTVVENPFYHKLLIVGDVAIIPAPDLRQKIAITNYLIKTAQSFGIEIPKLAIIAATEKANPKMPECVDAAIISKMAERGQIKGGLVDGPLALDVAVDMESVTIKGVKTEVGGDADCLLFPDIVSGNVFYKSMGKLCNSELAAVVVGTKAPAILPSRGDSEKSKLYSIALASIIKLA